MVTPRPFDIHSKFSAVRNSPEEPKRSLQPQSFSKSSPNLRSPYRQQHQEEDDEDQDDTASEGTITGPEIPPDAFPAVPTPILEEQVRLLKVKTELTILKYYAADLESHLQHVTELKYIRKSVEKVADTILSSLSNPQSDRSDPGFAKILENLENVLRLSQQAIRDETRYVVQICGKMDGMVAGAKPRKHGRAAK
jgi:hypothetical protein